MSPPPVATYRLQLRNGTGFPQAAALAPYLARLGVSHLYLSPILRARPGSTHGYDGADPREIDPSLGGEAGFAALVQALRTYRLGLVLDIVPNHLGTGADTPWWQDLLRWGGDGPGARFFDVDWRSLAGGTPGKLLLPVLGAPFGEVLAAGGLRLVAEADPPDLLVACDGHRFPLDPRTWPIVLEGRLPQALLDHLAVTDPADFPRLRAAIAAHWPSVVTADAATFARLLDAQAWRPAWWRAGNAMLNWRRFFDITELAGLRVEDEAVFAASHARVLDLVARGDVQGLRVDHVDGLADPGAYLARLDRAWRRAAGADARPWILVEKILGTDEELPAAWPVAGTTGYELANAILGLFVDPDGEAAVDAAFADRGGDPAGFAGVVRAAKRRILDESLAAETGRLVALLDEAAAGDPIARDVPAAARRAALVATVGGLDVYRTYGAGAPPEGMDRARLERALAAARGPLDPLARAGLDHLARVLLGEGPYAAIRTAFEQLTGPVMAKALEDTAFYRWPRLCALNEVGGEPGWFGRAPAAFHALLARRAERAPEALVATATHDTKRGEDTRLKIVALSEFGQEWRAAAARWRAWNTALAEGGAPDPLDLHLFHQTLVGVWPADLEPDDRDALRALAGRLGAYLQKACREAKRRTGWLVPDEGYEAGLHRFVARALDPAVHGVFLADVRRMVDALAPVAAVHGLAQTVLKLTVPGVPDIYQGTEGWDLTLVDPDNRRPPAFAALARQLDEAEPLEALVASWPDGRIKQAVIAGILAHRREAPALWISGRYVPLRIDGPAGDRFVAFAREGSGRCAVTVVPRLARPLLRAGTAGLDPDRLRGTSVRMPRVEAARWRDVLSGRTTATGGSLELAGMLHTLPVAVLSPAT